MSTTVAKLEAIDGTADLRCGHMDELPRLMKARSMLLILLATCKQTQLALDAVANVLDTQLSKDLGVMIERSEGELRELTATIDELSAK